MVLSLIVAEIEDTGVLQPQRKLPEIRIVLDLIVTELQDKVPAPSGGQLADDGFQDWVDVFRQIL